MFLDLRIHKYEKDIAPYIRKGILLDTSVFKIIMDGFICTRISKKKAPELEKVLLFLNQIKINNQWHKFIITPQILGEICKHLRDDYCRWHNYKAVINEIAPLLEPMIDVDVKKNDILKSIDLHNPVIEIGDISIFVVADNFINRKEKIAIMSIDGGINKKYVGNTNVLLLDYEKNLYNFA